MNLIKQADWYQDAHLHIVAITPAYGVLHAIRATKDKYSQNFIVPTWVLYSLCLNKGVKAEHLMGADTMGNFMSPETTQQIS